jgi:GTP-binding protein EngB required for normal cell division
MQQAGNMDTDSATALSDQILSPLIDRVHAIQAEFKINAILPHLEACSLLLRQKDLIDIGIFGRFKAGKSSLLNQLAGMPLLPVGVTPVTAVVTRIRYGPDMRAVVHYQSGRTADIPLESIKSFVSESGNHENHKKISSVTVELPSLRPYRGLQFVDTPGLDSVFQHNTDAALSWLPKVGLALVAVSVDPPLSKQDVALIRTLRSFTPRIAVVVTKADLLTDTETAEITAFISQKLRDEFDTDFQIVPYSIREEYEELRDAFASRLFHPLLADHDSARADIMRFKFETLLLETKGYLSLALAAADRADSDRAKLRNQILDEKSSFEAVRNDLRVLGRECAGRTRPWIMKRMDDLRPEIIRRATRELSAGLPELTGNLWKVSRAYEQLLMHVVARDMREVSQREGDFFCKPLEDAESTLSRAVQGFRDRLAGNILQALGISFDLGQFKAEISRPEAPHISVSKLFDMDIDLLWFLIPMPVFRGSFEKHFLNRIPWEIEKNLSRLATQWSDGINAAIQSIEADAENSVRDQITTVEALLSQATSESDGIRSAMEEIESQISVVRL